MMPGVNFVINGCSRSITIMDNWSITLEENIAVVITQDMGVDGFKRSIKNQILLFVDYSY